MTQYTARFLDRKQTVLREMEFRCATHEDAIGRLSSLARHYTLELWDDEQIIWKFDPNAPTKTPALGARIKRPRKPRDAGRRDESALRLVAGAA